MAAHGAVVRVNWDYCIRRCSGRLIGPRIVGGSRGAQNLVSRDKSKTSLERPPEQGFGVAIAGARSGARPASVTRGSRVVYLKARGGVLAVVDTDDPVETLKT